MKRLLSFIAALLILAPLSGGFVRAAETTTPSAVPVQSDAETRRAVLIKLFQLTEMEVDDLTARFVNVERPVSDPELLLAYDTLTQDFEDYLDLIESRLKELGSSYVTAEGVRVTADNFKKWREAVYDPGIREAFDFIILQQGSSILSVAEARYEKIVADVTKLKASGDIGRTEGLEKLLVEAGAKLREARLLRDKGYNLFVVGFRASHDELSDKFERIKRQMVRSSSNAPLAASVVDTETTTVIAGQPQATSSALDVTKETVQTLMKRSVGEIAATYKIFLQMRDLVYQK